jgi:hypothetical protein
MTGMLSVTRIEETLTDVCSAREAPEDEFEGYLSMIITELNMSTLRQQNMLMCNEWFGFDGLFARLLLD